jgi:hypothetical protein
VLDAFNYNVYLCVNKYELLEESLTYKTDCAMKKSRNQFWRVPLFVLLFSVVLGTFSCGNDEPDWMIGYYMSINSQVRLTLSEGEDAPGTTSNLTVDVLSTTVRNLRSALHEAYPQDTRTGNDAAVLTACDKIYMDYKASYVDKEGHTVCVINLYRAKKEHDVVVESTPLKTYSFGALPQDTTSMGN